MREEFIIHQWPQVPGFAKRVIWPSRNVTADRILNQPVWLQSIWFRDWKLACERYESTPAGRGKKGIIASNFNLRVRHALDKQEADEKEIREALCQLPPKLAAILHEHWDNALTEEDWRQVGERIKNTRRLTAPLQQYYLSLSADYTEIHHAATLLMAQAYSAICQDLSGKPDGTYAPAPEQLETIVDCKPEDRPKWEEFCRTHGFRPDSLPHLRRACDEKYWARRIRRLVRESVERAWVEADPCQLSKGCSNDASERATLDEDRQERWAKKQDLTADDGTVISGEEVLTRTQRDRKRHAELMARVGGLSRLADMSARRNPYLITISLPPHFHPTTTWDSRARRKGERHRNQNFSGPTPREAHEWAQTRWQRCRRAFRDQDLMPFWIRAAQPHEDGTPHYHVVTWLRDEHEAAAVEAILRSRYDGDHLRAIDVERLQGDAAAASRYAARTISYIGRAVAEEKTGDADEAMRYSEWARIWGIRRYTTSHSHATVWRLMRRKDLKVPRHLRQVKRAACRANFQRFLRSVETTGVRPAYDETTNGYGEPSKRLIGVRDKPVHKRTEQVYRLGCKWKLVLKDIFQSSERTVMPIYQGGGDTAAGKLGETELTRPNHRSHGRSTSSSLDPPASSGDKPPGTANDLHESGPPRYPLTA